MNANAITAIQGVLSILVEQNKRILEENVNCRQSMAAVLEQNDALFKENLQIRMLLEEQNKKVVEEQIQCNNLLHSLKEEHKQHFEDMKEENLKLYSHFAEEFNALRTKVEDLLQRESMSCGTFLPPMSTPEEILSFDKQVKEDDVIRSQVVKRFNSQSCDDAKKFVMENLKLIFKDDKVASHFSWSNTNQNIAVKDLYFIRLLKDVTLDAIPQTTTSVVEGYMKNYFNSAKDRLHKRIKRRFEVDA